MFLDILVNIGLSEKESKVYLSLLELGTQPASTIAKKADINRTTCYVILNSLIEKGLVTSYNKASIKYFAACEPDNLIKFLKNQKKKLERYSTELEDNIESLYQIEHIGTSKPRLTIFEGFENIKNIFNDMLDCKEIRSFTSPTNHPEKLKDYLKNEFHSTRIKKKIKLKSIVTYENKSDSTIRAKIENKEMKYLTEKFANFVDTYFYENKMSFVTYENERYSGIIIESTMLKEVVDNMFKIIWELRP